MLRLYDEFLDDETILALTHPAYRLHVSALLYCSNHLTDGRLNLRAMRELQAKLGYRLTRNVRELVRAGLWIEHGNTWEIRNYLEFNPAAVTVKRERAKARERMRKIRDGRVTNDDVTPERSPERSPARYGERSPAVPYPSLPKPLKPNELKALPTSYEGGHDEQLRRLMLAARVHHTTDADKLVRTVRSHHSTEADIAWAIEAATGPGVRDPLAVALAELVKRSNDRRMHA